MLIRNRAVLASAFALALSVSLAAEAERRPPADPAMIAARSRIFGPENVDQRSGQVNPERVVLSWITNASFLATSKRFISRPEPVGHSIRKVSP